jgi:hypothetical protein
MSTKSRQRIYGAQIQALAERAKKARQEADQFASFAWSSRMLGYKGPARPSPTPGDAINAGCGYLEVRYLGCDTHQMVALDIVRRPKHTPIQELERCLFAGSASRDRRYPHKPGRSETVRQTKISASDPPST